MSTPNAKNGGLKKTLFTPCRRIGLSRKVSKTPTIGTPTSTTSPRTPQIHEDNNSVRVETPQKCIATPKLSIGTPKVIKKPVIRNVLENQKRINEKDSGGVEPLQKSVQPPELKGEANRDKPNSTKVTEILETSVEEPTRHKRKLQSKTNPVDKESDPSVKPKNKSKVVKNLETKKENLVTKECTVQLNIEKNPSVLVSDSKLNVLKSKVIGEIRKPIKRLSMKKSSSSSEDLSDNEFNITRSTGSNSQVEVFEVDEVVVKPKRRRAVVSSSEDEDCAGSPSSSRETVEEDLQLKVQELSNEVKQKSLRLQDLQQASVYKNLHKVKELGELTRTWKNGCESAVRLLHKSLQDHGPISMPALLVKLNVPSEFLNYDVEDDRFS